jgi:hypothetical protein
VSNCRNIFFAMEPQGKLPQFYGILGLVTK